VGHVRHRRRITELRAKARTEAEHRELAILQWSAEFNDGHEMRHAEQMATPWFGINQDCFSGIWGELRRTWHEAELIDACRSFGVPDLIIDGSADLRPRSAVDSLAGALPNLTRVVLPGAGHVPWLEVPAEFGRHVLDFLRAP
jgi:proline iminopeptidase